MRVAGNKIKHIQDFYVSELSPYFERPEIDAILAHAVYYTLGFSKTDLLLKKEENINQSDLLKLYDCCKELIKGVPLQYILGETEFCGLRFYVNPSVLIPRPETEELVELILEENNLAGNFLDIGTGSGCIPVTIKKKLTHAKVFGCDVSEQALHVSLKNTKRHQTDVTFFEADILKTDDFKVKLSERFDVIVSNPPYIQREEEKEMTKQVSEHEPHLALFVEHVDPIIFYKKIIDLSQQCLLSGGRLYFELNPLTAESVKTYAEKKDFFINNQLIKDMSGKTRFFKATKA